MKSVEELRGALGEDCRTGLIVRKAGDAGDQSGAAHDETTNNAGVSHGTTSGSWNLREGPNLLPRIAKSQPFEGKVISV